MVGWYSTGQRQHSKPVHAAAVGRAGEWVSRIVQEKTPKRVGISGSIKLCESRTGDGTVLDMLLDLALTV